MQVRSPRSTEAYNWCEGQTSQMTSGHHFPRPVLNSNTITVLLLLLMLLVIVLLIPLNSLIHFSIKNRAE